MTFGSFVISSARLHICNNSIPWMLCCIQFQSGGLPFSLWLTPPRIPSAHMHRHSCWAQSRAEPHPISNQLCLRLFTGDSADTGNFANVRGVIILRPLNILQCHPDNEHFLTFFVWKLLKTQKPVWGFERAMFRYYSCELNIDTDTLNILFADEIDFISKMGVFGQFSSPLWLMIKTTEVVQLPHPTCF